MHLLLEIDNKDSNDLLCYSQDGQSIKIKNEKAYHYINAKIIKIYNNLERVEGGGHCKELTDLVQLLTQLAKGVKDGSKRKKDRCKEDSE